MIVALPGLFSYLLLLLTALSSDRFGIMKIYAVHCGGSFAFVPI